jgi:alpha-galactosidase
MYTTFINRSDRPLTLEMLSSFSLSGITPFAADDAPGRLFLHRFRSYWSAEGRYECRLAEDLALEPSWVNHAVRVERFGQVGSMPVRTFFPWAGVEDRGSGVLWGAQLANPASWQMEFFRRDDFLSLSGGLADREFGHWMKTVAPGDSFTSPVAYVSTVQGDLDDLCARLVRMQLPSAEAAPASEMDLPVICNEWCTSWGDPRHENLVAMADQLQGSGVKYLVIDAGWYKGDAGVWHLGQGDWIANRKLFPEGLAATAKAIHERGIIPGICFEMEVVGEQSPRFEQDADHVLHRDGFPITASGRRFWDFRDPWVIDYLRQKVIDQLRDAGLGYIKVNYNETIGIGCDGAESLGEGLRQHMAGVQDFFREMRRAAGSGD